jgi:uracil-DNA glycosylase family 4
MGYGDANADVHVVGDHPGVHGGAETGIPFTGTVAGDRVRDLLEAVGLSADGEDGDPELTDCYLSYVHCCCVPDGETPTSEAYVEFERFFDAELRAIGAHVLVPVGQRATSHVLAEYSAKDAGLNARDHHAELLSGSGFLVLPVHDPAEWTDADFDAAAEALADLLASDYAQTADLGRFIPGEEPYFVR